MNRECRYLIGRAAAALFIVLLSRPLLGIDVTQIRRVILSQEKAVLMAAESFVRTEDGLFIIPDYRDGNFKLYDDDGNLVAVWGKRGPGPLEFLSPRSCHYQPKILAVSDFSKQRILTFKRTGKTEKDVEAEYAKMSFVNTIFADEDFIGVVYQNYDGKDSLWKMYLQLYTPAGKLIKESPLPDAVTYINFRASNSFYDRESHTLYYLSIRYDEKTSLDRYEIVAFKIESERPEP